MLRRLYLDKLPAETAFDAKVAIGYGVVEGRSYFHDLAVLGVNGQAATDAAVGANRIRFDLARFIPRALPAHVVFGFEHQGARGADADAVTAIDAGGFWQGNFEFSGDVRADAAPRDRDGKGVLGFDAAGLHAFVAEDALRVIPDVKFVVDFDGLRIIGGVFPEARGIRAIALGVSSERGPGGEIHGRGEKFQHEFSAEAYALGVSVNHHAGFHFARAGGDEDARAFEFDNAEAADIYRSEVFEVAERGRFDAQLAGGFENCCTFADKKWVAVDFDFDHADRFRSGRAGQRAAWNGD